MFEETASSMSLTSVAEKRRRHCPGTKGLVDTHVVKISCSEGAVPFPSSRIGSSWVRRLGSVDASRIGGSTGLCCGGRRCVEGGRGRGRGWGGVWGGVAEGLG